MGFVLLLPYRCKTKDKPLQLPDKKRDTIKTVAAYMVRGNGAIDTVYKIRFDTINLRVDTARGKVSSQHIRDSFYWVPFAIDTVRDQNRKAIFDSLGKVLFQKLYDSVNKKNILQEYH